MTLNGFVAIVGLVLVGIGCWQVLPAAAWIVVGAALFGVAVFDVFLEGRKR